MKCVLFDGKKMCFANKPKSITDDEQVDCKHYCQTVEM